MAYSGMGRSILFGVGTIFVLATVVSLLFSTILRFTDTNETSFALTITILSFVSVFIGGFIAGGKGKEKGWLTGGLTGLAYTLIVLLFQFLGHDQLFSGGQWMYHGFYVLTAVVAGVLGVNVAGNSSAR
ncbi:TIGR04086 family membrane protein [Mangrovibacillus cuniculi]|nr:TIGR04086 family membrane protein [Mangrovibacillus cuniculi]